MGKRLVITYGDKVLYEDEPEEVTWRESRGVFTVKAGEGPNPLVQQLGERIQAAIAAKQQ